MTPLVSIIIPTYNRDHLIGETLDSILAQTYTNWECIVVDDGSTDKTSELLDKYCKKDTRFQYHQRPKDRLKGANSCRNYGFELSSGVYINWFDSDDLMSMDHIGKKVAVLNKNIACDFCVCRTQNFSGKFLKSNLLTISKNDLTGNLYEDYILGRFSILMIAPLWRRVVFENKKLFDEELKQSQDLDLYSRIIYENRKIVYLPEVLIYVRRSNDSITTKNNNINIDVHSFLEVKKRIVDRTPKNTQIRNFNIKLVMWLFRYKLTNKNYQDCEKCLEFVKSQIKRKSNMSRINLMKVIWFYKVFKFFKRGDTRFKFLLKL